MSVGGVLGGLFCALVAPMIFDWTYEHPILVVAAAFVLGATNPFLAGYWKNGGSPRLVRWSIPLLLLVSLIGQGAFGLPDSRFLALVGVAGIDCCGTARARQPAGVRRGDGRADAEHGWLGQDCPVGRPLTA